MRGQPDVQEMATLFHVTGGYTYVDPYGKALGYEDVFTKLENVRRHYKRIGLGAEALVGFRGVGSASCDQGGDERAKQGFAATACVVHELEEPEIERQLLLRETPVRAEPGPQQGPEPLDGIDVHLAEPVAILVAGVFAAPVADRLVLIAPALQAGVDAILVGVDEGAFGNRGRDDRLDRPLLHVGQHGEHYRASALDQAEDGWLVLLQRAPARRPGQPPAASEPPPLATAAGR